MKKLITTICFIIPAIFLLYQQSLDAAETGVFSKTVVYKGEERKIYFYVPENYNENQHYPLLVGMQSFYTPPLRMRSQLLDVALYFRIILAIPEDPLFSGDILPYCIDYCKDEYNIDNENVIVTGAGEGGTTAFVWGTSNPWTVKGVVGYAPMIAAVDYTMVNNRPFAAIRGKLDGQSSGTQYVMRDIKLNGGDTVFIEKENVRNELHHYYNSTEFTDDFKRCFQFVLDFVPKAAVRLISPSNISYAPPEPVRLTWGRLPGANKYEVIVSKSITTIAKDTVIDTTFVLPQLDSGEYFFWKVRHFVNDTAGEYSHKWSFRTKTSKPDIPVPNAPKNGEKDLSVYCAVCWNEVPRAEEFHVQVSKDDFKTLLANDSAVQISGTSSDCYTGLAYSNNHLEIATTYKWKVRARNIEGWSGWSEVLEFTTYIPQPVLLFPVKDTSGIPADGKFVWKKIPVITSFHLQVSKTQDFADFVIDKPDIKDTLWKYYNLNKGEKYYWRLRAVTAGGVFGQWSAVSCFTTELPLYPPKLVLPANDLVVKSDTVIFVWNKTNRALSYNLQVSGSPDFSDIYLNRAGISDTFFVNTDLPWNSTFFWRVKANLSNTETGWSEIWTFSKIKDKFLKAPVLVSPRKNAGEQPTAGVLSWLPVQEADSYSVQVSLSPDFSGQTTEQMNVVSVNHSYISLKEGIMYYWRVRAVNDNLSGPWSEVWNFSTIEPLAPPEISNIYNNQKDVPTDGAFLWNTLSGAESYHLQLSVSPEFKTDNQNLVINDSGITTSFINYSELLHETQYWLRMKQKQSSRESRWSDAKCFTTITFSDADESNESEVSDITVGPNPSSQLFRINIRLQDCSYVNITVLDLQGSELSNLGTDVEMNPGNYSFEWDAADMAPGMYIIRITLNYFNKYYIVIKEA